MPYRVETADIPMWKYPKHPKKIKALIRKRLSYVKKKQMRYKPKKWKLNTHRRLDHVRKEHRYHKYGRRKLK
ncbi:MAG: hypothetical protein ACFFBS_02520 [Promethearchaeota archaeon]